MPIRDRERRRVYNREYQRLRRSGVCQTPGQTQVPSEFRLKTAQDILNLLAEQVAAVRDAEDTSVIEKARTIGFLLNISLRAVESGDISSRVEALEAALRHRKEESACDRSTLTMIN